MSYRPPLQRFINVRTGYRAWNSVYGYPSESAALRSDSRYKTFDAYIVSNDNVRQRRKVKPVDHRVWSRVTTPIGYRFSSLDGSLLGRCVDMVEFNPQNILASHFRQLMASWVPDWDSAVNNVLPSFRNEFSLINFALEADELPRLANSLWQLLRNLPNHLRFLSGAGIQNRYLETQFGVMPLISDVEAVIDQYREFGERLGRARALLQRGVRASDSYQGPVWIDIPMTANSTAWPNGLRYRGRFTFRGDYEFKISCTVKGNIPDDPIREYLDYIGLYPDLGTLWNALPFSFLIDYILPIGQALEGSSWITPQMVLSKGSSSFKIDGTWSFRVEEVFSPTSGTSWIVPEPDMTNLRDGYVVGTYKRYMRYKEFPVLDGMDLPTLRFPNSEQQVNAAAIGNTFRNQAADARRFRTPQLRRR